MSGLVGYGSSSEEDQATKDGSPAQKAPGMIENTAAISSHPSKPREADGDINDEPVLGPSVSANGFNTTESAHDLSLSEGMSERDTVRYLTQATHPMNSIPPSPPGSPDTATNVRFQRFLDLKLEGIHFNEDLAKKAAFRNPSLLSSMMERAGIAQRKQYNTSLPKELWDPTGFPAFLLLVQMVNINKTVS